MSYGAQSKCIKNAPTIIGSKKKLMWSKVIQLSGKWHYYIFILESNKNACCTILGLPLNK